MTVGQGDALNTAESEKSAIKCSKRAPETQGSKDRENSRRTNSSSLPKFGERHELTTSINLAPVLRNTKHKGKSHPDTSQQTAEN